LVKLLSVTMTGMSRASAKVDEQLAGLAARLRMAIVPLARQLRQQTGDDVTPTQLSFIGSIDRHGPLTLGELAARERVSPPMVTKVVAQRVSVVALTPAGERWLREARARRNAWLAERLHALTPDERTALDQALPLIERLLEDDR
jgi:DNA-binding MarR family transcriptional regulator